jgi:O-antigen ligase/polysaccharide polymerase Wzy-like membrane protein
MTVAVARHSIPPAWLLRCTGALSAVLLADLFNAPLGASPLHDLALAVALLVCPRDLLPVIMLVTVRSPGTVLGPLTAADVIALVYLARMTVSLDILRVRFTRSRVALLLFLAWAATATAMGVGLYTALSHLALYAAVGMAATYRRQARTCLLIGVACFALLDVVRYLPSFPDRLWGVFVNDPNHVGVLLIAALLVVWASPLGRRAKLWLGGLLLFGIVMTMTRSIWFATGAVAIAALLPRRWYVPLVLPPVLGVLTLPLVSGVTSRFELNPHSRELRRQSMEIGLREFERHPFFGSGWAFTSAVRELGLTGAASTPTYNLWIHLGACVGLVGIALFAVFVALLAREAEDDTVAYLFLVGVLATSLSEMHFYAGSLTVLLFFLLTTTQVQRLPRSLASTSAHRSRETANALGSSGSGCGAATRRPVPGS